VGFVILRELLLAHQQYLTLETYWKTGTPVATPVWCAEDHGTFYIYTLRSHTPAR
jgi:hypothetical protein